MENINFFGGSDRKEGLSQAELQAFEEKMKKAATEMRAAQKREKKHKKKEEDLYKILLDFIKNSKNTLLVGKITDCLEKNIPAGFILAIIRLSNKEIEGILGVRDKIDTSIQVFGEESDLSPIMKIELNLWINEMMSYVLDNKDRVEKKAFVINNNLKSPNPSLEKLCYFIISQYLEQNNIKMEESRIIYFANFIMNGVLHVEESHQLQDKN